MTRRQFEKLCEHFFEKTIALVSDALKDAEMKKEEIDDIVLVGGSSHILRIQELLQKFFEGKQLHKSINLDECVAYGAAVQASLWQKESLNQVKDVTLWNMCPLSLGIELIDDSFEVIIPRNSSFPIKKVKTFATTSDNQTSFAIEIFERENMVARANHFLGHFVLDGIPPAPRGVPIKVEFKVDEKGILFVSAIEPRSKQSSNLTIFKSTRMSYEDAKLVLEVAERIKKRDNEQHKDFRPRLV